MTTVFPGAVDSFPRPTAATNTDDAGYELDLVVDHLSDAVEALERLSLPRRMWHMGVTNTGGSGYGWSWVGAGPGGAGTLGTASGTDTLTFTSAATTGSRNGIYTGTESHVTSSWLPYFEFRGKFSTITNVRTWVAIGMGQSADNDSAGRNDGIGQARGAGIRHSTVAGDTNYKYVVTSSTGDTIVDSGVAADTSEHVFAVEFLTSTSVRFSIDNAAVQIVTASSGVLDYSNWGAYAFNIPQTNTAISMVPRGAVWTSIAGGA